MKNYPTILWANDAAEKGKFRFVCDENLMRLRHELSDFCEEAYIEYAVLREKMTDFDAVCGKKAVSSRLWRLLPKICRCCL